MPRVTMSGSVTAGCSRRSTKRLRIHHIDLIVQPDDGLCFVDILVLEGPKRLVHHPQDVFTDIWDNSRSGVSGGCDGRISTYLQLSTA